MTVDYELNSILIKYFYSGDRALLVWNIVMTQVCTMYCQVSKIVLYLNIFVNLLESFKSNIGNKTFKRFVDFESALNDFQRVCIFLLAVILMYRLVEHSTQSQRYQKQQHCIGLPERVLSLRALWRGFE